MGMEKTSKACLRPGLLANLGFSVSTAEDFYSDLVYCEREQEQGLVAKVSSFQSAYTLPNECQPCFSR